MRFSKFLLGYFWIMTSFTSSAQNKVNYKLDSFVSHNQTINQLISTSYFLDALTSSFNTLNSLIKKENYRTKIATLNNPTATDLGFNLENEIQMALKPLSIILMGLTPRLPIQTDVPIPPINHSYSRLLSSPPAIPTPAPKPEPPIR